LVRNRERAVWVVEQSRGACVIPPNEDECRTAAIGGPDRESLAIPDTRGAQAAQAAVGRVYVSGQQNQEAEVIGWGDGESLEANQQCDKECLPVPSSSRRVCRPRLGCGGKAKSRVGGAQSTKAQWESEARGSRTPQSRADGVEIRTWHKDCERCGAGGHGQ